LERVAGLVRTNKYLDAVYGSDFFVKDSAPF